MVAPKVAPAKVAKNGQPGAANDPRLTEPSRHGPLPKIAQDGTRPSEAFARPAKANGSNGANGKSNGPRVAIVIGGLGIGAEHHRRRIAQAAGSDHACFRALWQRP